MSPLEMATNALESQLDVLKEARDPFKIILGYKKHLEHRLIRDAAGKSHTEKVTNAYASIEWESFSSKLAKLESSYDHEHLKFDVLKINYQTQYFLAKEQNEQIKKY